MDKTDNHPYLIQLLCERLFDGGRLEAVIEEVGADDLVAHFFSVDYENLEPFEKKILLLLQHRPMDADKLASRIDIGRDQVIGILQALKRLGCVKPLDGDYGISNFFLEMWLEREAPELWVEAAKGEGPHVLVAGATGTGRPQQDHRRKQRNSDPISLTHGCPLSVHAPRP